MNEPVKFLASFNTATSKINTYSNNEPLQEKRKSIFDIITNHNKATVDKRLFRGHLPSENYKMGRQSGAYNEQEAVEKINKLKKITRSNDNVERYVYMFDTETIGQAKAFNNAIPTDADIINNNIFSVTELSILRQRYVNGKKTGDPEKVINFSSSRSEKDLIEYISKVSGDAKYNSQTTHSSLVRIGGYSNQNNYIKKEKVLAWDPSANVADLSVLNTGAQVMPENMQYVVGTDEYNSAVKDIYKVFNEILSDENSALLSMNGRAFDNEVIVELFKNSGIDIGDDFLKSLESGSVDMQQVLSGTLKEKIFGLQNAQRDKGVADIDNNMKVSNLAHAANELGADINTNSNFHVAEIDNKISLAITDTFLDDLVEVGGKIEGDISKKVLSSTEAIYHANSALIADADKDIFFSNSGYSNANTYNPVIMEAGHSYKINALSVKEASDLPRDLQKSAEELAGKKILRFTDQYGDDPRVSYLVVDSADEIQNRLLDTGKLSITKETEQTAAIIRNSTEAAILDKTRVTRENFYKVNSDKGFNDFKMYFDMFDEYNRNTEGASKKALESSLKTGIISDFDGNEVRVQDALKRLFKLDESGDSSLIHERARNLVNLYDDFDRNRKLYSTMQSAVDEATGSYEQFISKYNLTDNNISKSLFNRAKTTSLSSIRESINNAALDKISDEDALNYILENNSAFKTKYEGRLKEINKKSKTPLSKSEIDTLKKKTYKSFFDEDYNKNSQNVLNYIFGLEEVKDTFKEFNGIDILSPENGYTRLQASNKQTFLNSLNDTVNYKITAPNKNPDANIGLRKQYVKEVARDLLDRGIIDNSTIDKINNSNTVQSMTEILGNDVYRKKETFENTILKYSSNKPIGTKAKGRPGKAKSPYDAIISKQIDYSKMNKDEVSFVRNFINKSRMQKIYAQKDGYKILGMTASDFVESKLPKMFENGMPTSSFMKTLVEPAKNSIPKILTYSSSTDINNKNKSHITKMLMDEFGWSENNADLFFKRVIKNKDTKNFKYKSTGKEVDGLTHHIVKSGNKGYLISAPKDRERMIIDKISQGVDIDDIKKVAGVWNIPNVEKHGSNKVIKQGYSTYKAVTNDIVLAYSKDVDGLSNIPIFKTEDTVDTVINSLANRMKYVKESMENRNFIGASSSMNRSWNSIHENKTLSAIVPRVYSNSNGAIEIVKEVGLNRADDALSSMIDISDLVYSLDIVTSKNRELDNSLMRAIGDDNKNDILNHIIGYKNRGVKDGIEKKTFDKWDTGFKLWYSDNISEIAKTITENESFMANNKDLAPILDRMKEIGVKGFYGKESGDANRGFYFLNPPSTYVAGSSLSGTSRPLVNQVMSALPMYENDMMLMAKYNLQGAMSDVSSIDDLYKKLNLKPSHSYMTSGVEDFIKMQREVDNGIIGFSTKVKIMESGEFLNKANKYSLDDNIGKIARENIINKLRESGISGLDNVTHEEVINAARGITAVTNVYEDSMAMSPLFSSINQPRTITSAKFTGDPSRFHIGKTIEPGEVLSKTGDEIVRYSKDKATIVGIRDGELTLQLNSKYRDWKIGVGGSEKGEAHTVVYKSPREALIADEVFKEMSDGANFIANPNYLKHESFNTMITSYTNAITDNINNQEELDYVNNVFKKHFGENQDIQVKYSSKDKRYVIVEGEKAGKYSGMQSFKNVIDDLKKPGEFEGLSKRISSNIENLEKNNIAIWDMVLMQDNTIQGYQGAENISQGAAISHRSQSVMGIFMDGDNLEDLTKYRKNANGQIVNLWQDIIDNEINELAGDKKFVRMQEQVQNIRASLYSSIGETLEGSNIVKYNIKDSIVSGSVMEAKNLPSIFSYENKGVRVHGYEVDISDLNLKIHNFMHDDLRKLSKENLKYTHGIEETVSKIFIPAMDANATPDGYTLSRLQKSASDLLNDINNFSRGDYGGKTKDSLVEGINEKYKEYIKALRYDLVDKEGFNKRSLKKKAEFSSRHKVAKIAAPITEDGFRYKDLDFRNTSTVILDGKKKHYGTVYTSLKDFTNKGLTLENVGRQLLSENLDDSDEALAIIKRTLGSNVEGLNKAKNVKEAQNIVSQSLLKGSKIKTKSIESLGESYLKEIGIYGTVMRDPAMKPGSHQAVRIRASERLTQGTISMDAITAKLMNADGDGDEVNLFMKTLTTDKAGNAKIKGIDDIERASLKSIVENSSDYNASMFSNVADDYIEKTMNSKLRGHVFEDYQKQIEEFRGFFKEADGSVDVDYFTGPTRYSALLSRFSKSAIGQVSNPNYYLRAAATSYYSKNAYDLSSYKAISNILHITDLAEQNLIDMKSIKNMNEGLAMANLAGSYRQSMDDIASRNMTTKKNGLLEMYKNLVEATKVKDLSDEDLKTARVVLGYSAKDYVSDVEQSAENAVQRILRGSVIEGKGTQSTIEEVLRDIYRPLQDEDSRKVFFSSFIRQSDINKMSDERLSELEKTFRDLNIDTHGKSNIPMEEFINSRKYVTSNVFLNDKALSFGDKIYSLEDNGSVGEGLYSVVGTRREGKTDVLELLDVDTKKRVMINGTSFEDISSKVKHMTRHDGQFDIGKALVDKYSSSINVDIDSLLKVEGILETANKDSLKYHAAKKALDGYDVNNLKDSLATVEILKSKGYISEDDGFSYLKSMNDAIREKGNSDYRRIKKEKLLGLKSLREKSSISTVPALDVFLNKEVTKEAIDGIVGSRRLSNDIDSLGSLKRFYIGDIESETSSIFDNIVRNSDDFAGYDKNTIQEIKSTVMKSKMNSYTKEDLEVMKKIKNIYSKHSDSLEFQRQVLNMDLDSINELLKNNRTSEALDAMNSAKVAYGEYIGLSISELDDKALKKILSGEYDSSGISNDVVNKTRDILNKIKEAKEEGYERKVIKPNISSNISVDEMKGTIKSSIKEMNEKIRQKGANGSKVRNLHGKSLIDKVSDAASSLKNNKKAVYGAVAAAGIALAGAYIYGEEKMKEKKGQYVSKNTQPQNSSIVKTQDVASGGKYQQVPDSNKKFYGTNQDNVSVNVSGKAPVGSRASNANDIFGRMFGGTGVKLNTSVSDSRRSIEDRDVETLMSQATRY